MQRSKLIYGGKLALLIALLVVGGAGSAMADTPSSPNYQLTEAEFGAGATIESCGSQYCASASIGGMTGTGSGGESSADFGSIPDEQEPLLEVIIENGPSDLGVLAIDQTATQQTIIKVRNYLSNGYAMQVMGQPPAYGDHRLEAASQPSASSPGKEQFGLNLVTNTEPPVGKDPIQVPSSGFSFGEVTDDYQTANRFKYVSGDVVALSRRESGQTEYTLSMILNVSGNTPAGHYASDFSIVVVPVF